MPYNDIIYQLSSGVNKRQGNCVIFMPNAITGFIQRGDTVDYQQYVNTVSGKQLPQWLFKTSGT